MIMELGKQNKYYTAIPGYKKYALLEILLHHRKPFDIDIRTDTDFLGQLQASRFLRYRERGLYNSDERTPLVGSS